MKISRQLIIFIVLLSAGFALSWTMLQLNRSDVSDKLSAAEDAKRVITFSPAAAEVIYAIGAQDRLVGVSGFCTYPPQLSEKLKVGDSIYPNFERISVLKPDLVIMMGENPKITEFCRNRGIEVLRLGMFDIKGLYNDIEILGIRLESLKQAEKLINDIREKLAWVKTKVAGRQRPKVFLSFFRSDNSLTGLSTVGDNTHLDNLIEIAGGVNVFGDIKISFPRISKESLLKLMPEVIIEPRSLADIEKSKLEKYKNQWQAMSQLPAVRDDRIYFPDADLVLKPGPRIGEAARILAQMLHPDAFKN